MTHTFRRWATNAAVVALGALALTVAGAAERQAPAGAAGKLVVNDTALPGIDRGLARYDPPLDPVDRSLRGARMAEPSGEPPTLYERGVVIVKFKDGDTAQRAGAMRAVGGRGLRQPAWADFELMTLADEADPEAVAASPRRPARGRVRAGALSQPCDVHAERPVLLVPVEPDRRSTWSAPGTSIPARPPASR